MALKIESGRVEVRTVGSVPMQQITPRGVDYVGPRAEAQSLGTMAQILDSMSDYAFGESKKMRFDEGLQYAAQNPVTPQQLEAAKNGDLTTLVPTGNFTYFDQAVRKARSLELSSHFEVEGRNELAKLLSDIEAGTANSEQVSAKIATLTEGYGKTLAKVDGEAALKFRATMATHGNTVLSAAYSAELKRAKAQRMAKFDMDFDNSLKILQTTIEQHPDKIDAFADVFRKNTLTQSLLLGDAAMQREYSTKFEKALRDAKIQVLTKHFTSGEFSGVSVGALRKIETGDAGNLSPVLQQLISQDFGAVAEIRANVMTAISNRRTEMESAKAAEKLQNEGKANDLFIEFFNPQTSIARRKQIGNELAGLKVLSVDQMERFLNPKVDGDPYAYADLETQIATGNITDSAQLRKLAARAGMSGEQYARLNTKLLSGYTKDETAAFKIMQNASGLPDVIGVRTKDDQHMFDKRRVLNERFENAKREKLQKGEAFDPVKLAYEVIDNYNKVDGANVKKEQARKKIDRTVQDIRTRKKMPESFTIDSTTNLDDLLSRKIIDNDQYEFLKNQQRILREVTQ